MISIRAGLAVAAILAALAGCGDEENGGFKSDYEDQQSAMDQLGRDVGAAVRGAQKEDASAKLGSEFAELSQRTKGIVRDLGRLKPPANLKAPLNDVKSSFLGSAEQLGAIAKAEKKGDTGAARNAVDELVQGSQQVIRAAANFDKELN